MEDYTITSIQKYLDIIKNYKSNGNLYYRGISTDAELLPKIFRKLEDKGYLEEEKILKAFKQCAKVYLNFNEEDNLEWLTYAQHYQVPTRLLDFTENPLVALFFACYKNQDKNDKNDGVIYIIAEDKYNALYHESKIDSRDLLTDYPNFSNFPSYPIFHIPMYLDQRMAAQSSLFLLWGTDKRSLNEQCINDNKHSILKLKISGRMKNILCKELDSFNINEKTLFPGLDGVGQYINRHYQDYLAKIKFDPIKKLWVLVEK